MKSTSLLLLVMLVFCSPAFSEDNPALRIPSITLDGTGEATVVPDIASVTLGVISDAPNAKDSLAQNTRQMLEVMKALRQYDIADRDIQTVTLKIEPRFHDEKADQRVQNKVLGYTVSNLVRVRFRNLPKMGELLTAVVAGGATYVREVEFSLAEPEVTLEKARLLALRNATRKAEAYAAAAGAKLGQAESILEHNSSVADITFPFIGDFAAAQAPISTGEQVATAKVTVTFSLIYPKVRP